MESAPKYITRLKKRFQTHAYNFVLIKIYEVMYEFLCNKNTIFKTVNTVISSINPTPLESCYL